MDKNQINEDIVGFNRISKYGYDPLNNKNYYNKYGKLYPFNNENLIFYYGEFNYDGPILTVASSGDHMLHAILKDSTDITLFDINRLTKYYCMLKLAAIKALKYEEFFDYFRVTPKNVNINKESLYNKISKYLSEEDKYFWDSVINNGLNSNNFYNSSFDSSCTYCSYWDKSTYYKLQKKAKENNININFIESDIFDLIPKIDKDKKFSSVFLSNISDYIDSYSFEEFLSNKLKNHLSEESLIQTDYFTDYDKLGLDIVLFYETNALKKKSK